MKHPARLLAFPALFAISVGVGYWNGFLWPVALTFARIIAPQPETMESEPDPIG